jgi:hypothetical protein
MARAERAGGSWGGGMGEVGGGRKKCSAALDIRTDVWYNAVEGRDGGPGALEFRRLLRGAHGSEPSSRGLEP